METKTPHPEAPAKQSVRSENESLTELWAIESQITLPVTTTQMISLCELCGYKMSRSDLNYLFGLKLIARPPKVGTRMQWSRSAILGVMDCLESQRRWRTDDPRHFSKFTPQEQLEARREQAASEADMACWIQQSPRDLLLSLLESENRNERQIKIGLILAAWEQASE